MWVKIHLHIYLVAYRIVIFITILTGTALYGEGMVEAKCLWLYFHVKFCLQCFRIIMICHDRTIVRKKSSLINFMHSFLPIKHNKTLWYAYFKKNLIMFHVKFRNRTLHFSRCFYFLYVGLLIRPFFMSSFFHIVCINLIHLEL